MKRMVADNMPFSLNGWRAFIQDNFTERLELVDTDGSVIMTHDPAAENIYVFINFNFNVVFAAENLDIGGLEPYKADLIGQGWHISPFEGSPESFYTDPEWMDQLGEDIAL